MPLRSAKNKYRFMASKKSKPEVRIFCDSACWGQPVAASESILCCIHDSAGMPPNFCRINDKRCSTLVGCAAFGGPARLGTRS